MVRRQAVDGSEARFDGRDHEVADILALDAFGRGDKADRLAVAAVEREGDTDLLAVVAGRARSRPSTSAGWN